MRRVWGSMAHVVLVVAILLTAATARALEPPTIDRIRELGAEADFEASARLARERLASGALDRAEAAETYLELGIVEIARGDQTAGVSALRRALKLEPALSLPDTVGPHVREVFAEAKKQTPLEPLTVSVTLSAKVQELGISARVSGNAERIARRLVVEGEGIRRAYELASDELRKTERFELGTTPCVTLVASVQDEFGNRLWPAIASARVCSSEQAAAPPSGAAAAPANRNGEPPAPPAGSGERPIPTSVWIAGSVTVGLVAVTTVLGLTYLDRRSEYDAARKADPASENLPAMHESAERMSDMATVAGLAAGVGAITTTVLYVARPKAEGVRAAGIRASLSPTGVLVSGEF